MTLSAKGFLAPLALSLAMLFQSATARAQEKPEAPEPGQGIEEIAGKSVPVQEYRNARSPYPLYASADTHAKLGSVITDRLAEWAGQPVMVLAKEDIFTANIPSFFDSIPIETPHGRATQGIIMRQAFATVEMKKIMESQEEFFRPVAALGSEASGSLASSLAESLARRNAAAISFSQLAPANSGCVVTLRDLSETGQDVATDFLGIPAGRIAPFPGDALSWNVWIYLHEVAGHCANNHAAPTSLTTLKQETEADAIAIQKYYDLIKEGMPLDPQVPAAGMALRAVSSMRQSPSEPAFRLTPADISTHTTNVGVSFLTSSIPLTPPPPERIVRGLMAANTKIHDLVFRAFAEHYMTNVKNTPGAPFKARMPNPDKEGEFIVQPYTPDEVRKLPDERVLFGGGMAHAYPPYYYAAMRALLDTELLERSTFAYRHAREFVDAIDKYVPSMADPVLVEQAKVYMRDNNLYQQFRVGPDYENNIIGVCGPPQPFWLQKGPPLPCIQ